LNSTHASRPGVVYLAPSLAIGRGQLSGVDPFTKLRWVASAGGAVGRGFYVVSREGNSRVPC
jgi:hypothetical protein